MAETHELRPRVTIVTICFRNPAELRRTLRSLASLPPEIFERLVIDGSPDGRCEMVSAEFSGIRHLRQPDSGKYDAMNKGIAAAAGQTLLFMNSGDRLVSPERLEEVAQRFGDRLTDTLLYGDAIFEIGDVPVRVPAPELTSKGIAKGVLPSHQAVLIPAHFHRRHCYDDTMHFAADTKFLKQAFAALPAEHLPYILARFQYGGVSNSAGSWRSVWRQFMELREAHELAGRETFSTLALLMRRKIWCAIFGERGFRRIQRDRLITTGRAEPWEEERTET